MKGLGNPATFDIPTLTALTPAMPAYFQILLFFAFFFGFAIKVPMFPFHTWLPDAHVEAPTAGSVILAGVLLKMGTYGFVRFSLPMFPKAITTHWVAILMIGISIVGIIYGAMVSLVQKDMKKLVAYSSVSHLGFVMLGIFALNPAGLRGGILQMVNHGISTGALFLLVGIVYERRHTRMISEYGGLAKQMPVYAVFFLVMAMSSMGLPLLNGFVGEFTILNGAYLANPWYAFWALWGVVLGAAYLLWLYQRVFFGELANPANQSLPDMNAREQWTLIPLVVCALWIGLYPQPFFDVIARPVDRIVSAVEGASAAPRTNAALSAGAPASAGASAAR
jgi:NADH-quinone oxidoreductase subunit M